MVAPARRVMSLQEPQRKMSKSHKDPRSRILITDSPEVIARKIMAAKTDSINSVSFDPLTRPGVSNLLSLLSHFDEMSRTPAELGAIYSSLNLKELKLLVIDSISNALAGIGAQYEQLMREDDGRFLDQVEKNGAQRAQESAEETMSGVRAAIGF